MQKPTTAVIRGTEADATLAALGDYRFAALFSHGSLDVGVYAPVGVDTQQPHTRDELYLVRAGSARFVDAAGTQDVSAGDVVFVAANAEHRFEAMSEGFSAWVLFWGPEGGEANQGGAK
ncbi:MAG TPA: cupin domain-containing protein [Pseudomonadales bacterium]|nr:cupin domain-containing protein [Pseudomonadales bacterium]